jgi:8-oxo-dGTP diphosphatase
MVVDWDFRHERVRVFELRLRAEPMLRIDNREIVAARFVDPQALLAERGLPPFIRAHLAERHADDPRSPAGD